MFTAVKGKHGAILGRGVSGDTSVGREAVTHAAAETIRSHHGLRGVAAFLVLMFHFRDVTKSVGDSIDAHTAFFSTGYIWVDFFFILSGFILTHVYGAAMARAHDRDAQQAARRFYVARFARIYPLHFATLLAMIALELSAYLFRPEIADAFVSNRKGLASILQNLTLTHAWLTLGRLEWNVPSWSISTEAFAYLIFPLLLALSHHRSVMVRALLPVAALAIYVHTFVNFKAIQDQQPLARCLASFVSGMLLHRLWQRHGAVQQAVAGVLQLGALAAAVVAMHFGWSQALVVVAFALLIFSTADDHGPLARMLTTRPLLFLGTLSYSIYMTHWIVYRLYWMYGENVLSGLASEYSPVKVYFLKVILMLALTLTLSLGAFRYIELPARRYITRKLSR